MPTFRVTVRLTTHADSDDHLRDEQAIRGEVQSWLESLRVVVHGVTIHRGDKS